MANVVLKVQMAVSPTAEELAAARREYEPTSESPGPDEEWLAEEVAMNRLMKVTGVVDMTCVDTSEGDFEVEGMRSPERKSR